MKRWRTWRIFRAMRPLARLFDSGRRRAAGSEDGRVDLGSFGWLPNRGDRTFMLEVRHKNGNISAFNYNTLDQAEFDPSDGISLTFYPCTKVKIVGRNLNDEVRPNVRLVAGILQHRVAWIHEADEPEAMLAPKDATVIEDVEVK
jgi:hypothetical protein